MVREAVIQAWHNQTTIHPLGLAAAPVSRMGTTEQKQLFVDALKGEDVVVGPLQVNENIRIAYFWMDKALVTLGIDSRGDVWSVPSQMGTLEAYDKDGGLIDSIVLNRPLSRHREYELGDPGERRIVEPVDLRCAWAGIIWR